MGRILEDNNKIPMLIFSSFPVFKENFLNWVSGAHLSQLSPDHAAA